MTSICSLGFLANIITIVVIASYRTRSTFDKLLLSLAVIDCLVLLVFFVDSGLSKLDVDFPYWYNYAIPFIHFVKVDSTEFFPAYLNKNLYLNIVKYFSAFCDHQHNIHGCHHFS